MTEKEIQQIQQILEGNGHGDAFDLIDRLVFLPIRLIPILEKDLQECSGWLIEDELAETVAQSLIEKGWRKNNG